jgi:hypothetical protein
MATTILEVSRSNADIVTNSSLTTIFNPPIDVPTTSVLNFQQGFLDLRGLGNSGTDSFILDEDQLISIDFSVYECYLDQFAEDDNAPYQRRFKLLDGSKVNNDNETKESVGKMHVMYVVKYTAGHEPETILVNENTIIDSFELVVETFSTVVPKGIYTSDSLVKFMNDQLQAYNKSLVQQYGANIADFGFTSNPMYRPFRDYMEKYTTVIPATHDTKQKFKTAVVFLKLEDNPISFDYKTKYADGKPINIGYTYKQFQEPDDEAKRITADLMIGCPIASLSNNNGIISFDYLHNPVYQIDKTSGDRNEFVQIQSNYGDEEKDGDKEVVPFISNYFIFARGGVNIVDLNPLSFWSDLLGFDMRLIKLQVTKGLAVGFAFQPCDFINATGDNSFNSSTTRPFFGTSTIDSYVNYDTVKEEILTTEYNIQQKNTPDEQDGFRALDVVDTESINAISPIQFAQFNTGGHFLISIDIGYYVNNFNGSKLKTNITCVASREYLTNGFLSILSGGTPIILEAGSVISYIQLNIIDPITKQPATDIGINNSFYLTLSS